MGTKWGKGGRGTSRGLKIWVKKGPSSIRLWLTRVATKGGGIIHDGVATKVVISSLEYTSGGNIQIWGLTVASLSSNSIIILRLPTTKGIGLIISSDCFFKRGAGGG